MVKTESCVQDRFSTCYSCSFLTSSTQNGATESFYGVLGLLGTLLSTKDIFPKGHACAHLADVCIKSQGPRDSFNLATGRLCPGSLSPSLRSMRCGLGGKVRKGPPTFSKATPPARCLRSRAPQNPRLWVLEQTSAASQVLTVVSARGTATPRPESGAQGGAHAHF